LRNFCRGDLERCLIVAPGNLVEQWQDEMAEKFGLGFDPLTRDQVEPSLPAIRLSNERGSSRASTCWRVPTS
jgi:hypothetical protein